MTAARLTIRAAVCRAMEQRAEQGMRRALRAQGITDEQARLVGLDVNEAMLGAHARGVSLWRLDVAPLLASWLRAMAKERGGDGKTIDLDVALRELDQ